MTTGCETLNKLWKVALECNIEKPGIGGVTDRVIGFIQCKNIRDFMVMATLKCWEEKNDKGLPPVIVVDEITNTYRTDSKSTSKSTSTSTSDYNLQTKK